MSCKRRFIPQLKLSEDSDQNDDARILRSTTSRSTVRFDHVHSFTTSKSHFVHMRPSGRGWEKNRKNVC
jgi:hypothetical protein